LVGRGQFPGDVFEDCAALRAIGFFLGQAEIGFQVARLGRERLLGVDAFLVPFPLLKEGLSLRLIVPEIGGAYLLFRLGELLGGVASVKDNSARVRRASEVRRNAAEGLRCVRA
jgi:hypothetical protein